MCAIPYACLPARMPILTFFSFSVMLLPLFMCVFFSIGINEALDYSLDSMCFENTISSIFAEWCVFVRMYVCVCRTIAYIRNIRQLPAIKTNIVETQTGRPFFVPFHSIHAYIHIYWDDGETRKFASIALHIYKEVVHRFAWVSLLLLILMFERVISIDTHIHTLTQRNRKGNGRCWMRTPAQCDLEIALARCIVYVIGSKCVFQS